MSLKELIINYAEQKHVFDECDMLRDLIKWMDARPEYLNQNKSHSALFREFLKDQTK